VEQARQAIASMPALEAEATEARLRALAADLGLEAGQLFGILRAAVTGQTVSPPLTETMAIIGNDAVHARLDRAIQILSAAST
jgi:glutamyl-tRNA synthetase